MIGASGPTTSQLRMPACAPAATARRISESCCAAACFSPMKFKAIGSGFSNCGTLDSKKRRTAICCSHAWGVHAPEGCHVPPRAWFVCPHAQQKSARHCQQRMCRQPPFFSIGAWQLGHGLIPSLGICIGRSPSPWRDLKTRHSAQVAGQCGSSPHDGHHRSPHAPHAASKQRGWSPGRVVQTSETQAAFGQYESVGWLRIRALERIASRASYSPRFIASRSSESGATTPQLGSAQRIMAVEASNHEVWSSILASA
mmetsp:Transcript_32999/g.97785  ORF Transcript_32999/g.97785 Transcript_32999/m.97785 type:complete len:256 (+) Transcript_32999:1589-2356(+)